MTQSGRNMDEPLNVLWMHDFSKGDQALCNYVAILSAAAGNHNITGLIPAPHGVEYNILLQHAVVAEGGVARLENMKPVNLQVVEKVFAERAKIRAITKAPRRDADKLPVRSE